MPEPKLNLLVLKTHDLPRLRNFFAPLGLAFVEEQHGKGPVHFAAHCGDLVLELYPLPDDASVPDATTRLGFAVADLEATLQGLRALGAEVVREPRATAWGRQAVVRDPDGRSVELTEG
jgi:catechol 2,3-dioxygenase-like lactoylglutathione lyase family enzyme